jgi:hypothetical protein
MKPRMEQILYREAWPNQMNAQVISTQTATSPLVRLNNAGGVK